MKGIYTKVALLAAGVLLLASCAKDDLSGAGASEGTVTFRTVMPASYATRVAGDGTTAEYLHYAVYASGETTPLMTSADAANIRFENLEATLTLRLALGRTYDVIFWADAYEEGAEDTPYTLNWAAQTIGVSYDGAQANDEKRDAFYGAVVGLKIEGPVSEDVTLKRPFAQVNVGVTDRAAWEASTGGDYASLQCGLTVTNAGTTLDLLTGMVTGAATAEFAATAVQVGTLTAGNVTCDYLSMNYVLVGAEQLLSDCTIRLVDGTEREIRATNVPMQGNYRTNIYGALLTGVGEWNVTIDPGFDGDETYSELQLAAQNGGEVTLEENVELEQPLRVETGKTLVINLDGGSITYTGTESGGAIDVYGELIINGEGTVDGGKGATVTAVAAMSADAKVTINGGHYKVGADASGQWNDCIYAKSGGQIIINGGTFESAVAGPAGIYTVLNVNNGDPGTITVYGGTFINYDPATGDDNLGNTGNGKFLAEGYISERIGTDPDTYEVRKAPQATVGSTTYTSLAEAVENAQDGEEIVVSGEFREDVQISKRVTIRSASETEPVRIKSVNCTSAGGPVVFEGVEFYGAPASGASVYVTGSATFRNCHFAQESDVANNTRPIEVMPTGDVVIEGCTFDRNKAVAYFNPVGENGSLTIRNSTFARGISVELQNAGQPIYSIPVIEGCTLMDVSFTSQSGATDVESLSAEEKTFANAVLRNNEFSPLAGFDGDKVRAYISGQRQAINDPLPLATIGGGVYDSLHEAVDNIKEGDTVELEGGFDLTSELNFNVSVNLVGNDVTLTGAPVRFNGENVTVSGITFDNGTNATGNGSAVYVSSNKCKNIVFENCTFTNSEWDAIQLTDRDIESITIRNCTFRNTEEGGYRYIHLELRDNGQYAVNPTAKLTIENCTFENVSKTYCKDSAITIVGFDFDNMNIRNNIVKGDGADALSTSIIWICDGIDFGSLMSLEDINQKFLAE